MRKLSGLTNNRILQSQLQVRTQDNSISLHLELLTKVDRFPGNQFPGASAQAEAKETLQGILAWNVAGFPASTQIKNFIVCGARKIYKKM